MDKLFQKLSFQLFHLSKVYEKAKIPLFVAIFIFNRLLPIYPILFTALKLLPSIPALLLPYPNKPFHLIKYQPRKLYSFTSFYSISDITYYSHELIII